jgi:hypothetical protein
MTVPLGVLKGNTIVFEPILPIEKMDERNCQARGGTDNAPPQQGFLDK